MNRKDKTVSPIILCTLCCPIVLMLLTVQPLKFIVLLFGTPWLLHRIIGGVPKGGYQLNWALKYPITTLALAAVLGWLFYYRWIPSSLLVRISALIGISNSSFLLLVVFFLEIPLVCSINFYSQIIQQYLDNSGKEELTQSRGKRLQALQIVRVFACIEIFFSHCLTASGASGVSLFFVLSGFLMVYNHLEDRRVEQINTPMLKVRYAYSKIAKLYPLHIIMMFIAVAMAYIGGTKIVKLVPQIATQAILVQTWIPVKEFYYELNGISWYLATCVFTYFCFPRIAEYLKHVQLPKQIIFQSIIVYGLMLLIGGAVGQIFRNDRQIQYYLTYVCPVFRVWDFVLGCNLGYVYIQCRDKIKLNRWMYTWLEVVCIILLWGTEFCSLHGVFPVWFQTSLMNLPISLMTVFVFAIGRGLMAETLQNSCIIHWIARNSPYFFLIHLLLLGKVQSYFGAAGTLLDKYLIAVITFIATMLFSEIYGWIFEMISKKGKENVSTYSGTLRD